MAEDWSKFFGGEICVQTELELKVLCEHKHLDGNSSQSPCRSESRLHNFLSWFSHVIQIPAHLISKGMYPSQGTAGWNIGKHSTACLSVWTFLEVVHALKTPGFLSWLRSLTIYHFYYQDVSMTNIYCLELLRPGIVNPEISSYLEGQKWRDI